MLIWGLGAFLLGLLSQDPDFIAAAESLLKSSSHDGRGSPTAGSGIPSEIARVPAGLQVNTALL